MRTLFEHERSIFSRNKSKQSHSIGRGSHCAALSFPRAPHLSTRSFELNMHLFRQSQAGSVIPSEDQNIS